MNESMKAAIDAGVYKSKLPHPLRYASKKYYVYHLGEVLVNGMVYDDKDKVNISNLKATWQKKGFAIQEIEIPEHESTTLEAYLADCARLEALYKADLAAAYGMTDHPKAALLYERAQEQAEANDIGDMYDIMHAYEYLITLVK